MRERFTQIPGRNTLQEPDVLLGDRTIQPIPGAKCLSHLGGGTRVVQVPGEWFSRRGVNQEEREGRRQPDDEQTLRHPLQDDARHVRAKIRWRAETGHDARFAIVRYAGVVTMTKLEEQPSRAPRSRGVGGFPHPARSGAANMAIDQALMALARRTGENVLRVYTWSAPTLSLGRHQSVRGRVDQAVARTSACRSSGAQRVEGRSSITVK